MPSEQLRRGTAERLKELVTQRFGSVANFERNLKVKPRYVADALAGRKRLSMELIEEMLRALRATPGDLWGDLRDSVAQGELRYSQEQALQDRVLANEAEIAELKRELAAMKHHLAGEVAKLSHLILEGIYNTQLDGAVPSKAAATDPSDDDGVEGTGP